MHDDIKDVSKRLQWNMTYYETIYNTLTEMKEKMNPVAQQMA